MKPLTRKEAYLARMAGEDVQMPEPLTREEAYMKGIASQIEAGAAELPAVTDADEGKVLTVNENGKWAAEEPETPSTNAFDIFWNSKGTEVGSNTESISTGTTTTSSLALSGEMDFTNTFKGIFDIASQMGGTVYYAKYLLFKRAGDTTVNASKLYELGSAIGEISFSLTGGVNPGLPATALNVAMTGTANIGVVITLYSV